MATSEEKTELVETLKGPRYYRVLIQGYGGESAYMNISKEAYDFWKDHTEQNGDSDLVNYIVNAEDGEFEFDELEAVPTEAEFLTDSDGDVTPWFESHCEFEHSYGGSYENCRIDVDEVDSAEYNATGIREIISMKDVSELVDEVLDESENQTEIIQMDVAETPDSVEYIAQMYSSEKGCFFDGLIETVGDFDPTKLKIYTTEYLNGEDTITSVEYDGVEVDNNGGDTNGKGYSAAVWEY